ncbi:MAG: hypothetical protein AAF702_26855 [Chloroflexota bacterium]
MAFELPQDELHQSSNQSSNPEGDYPASDDFFLLMSMALDDMLSQEESERFHRYMEQDPSLAAEWQRWQVFDGDLQQEPLVEPPADFLTKLNLRLDDEIPAADEFFLWMSLALDGQLSKEEEVRFHGAMEEDPILANEWQRWQSFDNHLSNQPSAMPAMGFVERVNASLTLELRRRKLWLAASVGITVATVWVVVAVALFLVGSYMVTNQGIWLGDQVQNLAYLVSSVREWFTTVGLAIGRSLNVTLSYPQMWGMVLGYVMISGLILAMWTRLLHRSVLKSSALQGTVAAS